jgi:S1-C subfamily serine protease
MDEKTATMPRRLATVAVVLHMLAGDASAQPVKSGMPTLRTEWGAAAKCANRAYSSLSTRMQTCGTNVGVDRWNLSKSETGDIGGVPTESATTRAGLAPQSLTNEPQVRDLVDALLRGDATESQLERFLDVPESAREDGEVRVLEFRANEYVPLVVYGTTAFGLHRNLAPLSAKEFRSVGKRALSTAEYLQAIATVEQCKALGRACKSETDKLVRHLLQYDFTHQETLEGKSLSYTLLSRAIALETSISTSRLEQQLQTINVPLRNDLFHLIEALQARPTANRAGGALPRVRDLISNGRFGDAWAILKPLSSYSAIDEAIPELATAAASWFDAQLGENHSPTALARILDELNAAPRELVSASELRRLQGVISDRVRALIMPALPEGFALNTPEGRRIVSGRVGDLLAGANETLVSALFPAPPASVRIRVSHDCSLSTSEHLSAFVARHLPPGVVVGDGGGVGVGVAMTCELSDTVRSPEPMPSSYIAGVQQLANPAYLQAQTALAAAQAALARVELEQALQPAANAWVGAAYGLARGTAQYQVLSAQRHLADTPAYLSNPVSAPYSAMKRRHTREGRLLLRVGQLTDSDAIAARREVAISTTASGDEITGVMATDNNGLSNEQSDLPTPETLYTQALSEHSVSFSQAITELLQAAWLERARASRDQTVRLGSLLLAADLGPDSPQLIPYRQVLQQLRSNSTAELFRIALPSPPTRPSADSKRAATRARPATSRAATVGRALAALVSIRHKGGQGSGFAISADGLVLTNAHVIEGATRLTARSMEGDEYLVSVVQSDALRDIAVLRLAGWNGTSLHLAVDPDAVQVGEDVLAVGNPLGLEGTVTRGIVSAKRKLAGVSLVQIDAAISPGSSGGPLINEAGEVIGITSWKMNGAKSDAEALGFAVSSSEVTKVFGTVLRAPRN